MAKTITIYLLAGLAIAWGGLDIITAEPPAPSPNVRAAR
jgi:hypothetical protein